MSSLKDLVMLVGRNPTPQLICSPAYSLLWALTTRRVKSGEPKAPPDAADLPAQVLHPPPGE